MALYNQFLFSPRLKMAVHDQSHVHQVNKELLVLKNQAMYTQIMGISKRN